MSTEGTTGVLSPEHSVRDWHELCLFLGGDRTSFTGLLLDVIAKADMGNRARLRLAFPWEVAAYEAWNAGDPSTTASALLAATTEWLDRRTLGMAPGWVSGPRGQPSGTG